MRRLSKSIGGRRAWAHLLARAGHRRSCTQQHPKQNANVAPTVHLFGLPHAWTAVPLRSRRGLSDSIRITCTSLVSTNCTIPSHHQLANQTDSTYPRASNSYQSLLASAFDSVLPFNFPHLPQPGKISSLIRKTPRQSRLIVITCPLTPSRRDPVSSSSLLSACLNTSADQNKDLTSPGSGTCHLISSCATRDCLPSTCYCPAQACRHYFSYLHILAI
jgi:hypothetical protein